MVLPYQGSARFPGVVGLSPQTARAHFPGPLGFKQVDLGKGQAASTARTKTVSMPPPWKNSTAKRVGVVDWKISKGDPATEDIEQGGLPNCPVGAILAALADGTVDAIATDHAPHAPHEKIIEFERAAFGITGLETAVGLAITHLHRRHKIPLVRIVELFTSGPARVFSLRGRGTLIRGSHADVTIFDPQKRWTFDAAKSHSRSQNSPFGGAQFTGKVVATIVAGRIVYRAD